LLILRFHVTTLLLSLFFPVNFLWPKGAFSRRHETRLGPLPQYEGDLAFFGENGVPDEGLGLVTNWRCLLVFVSVVGA